MPALDAQTPTSHPAAPSASRRRAAYGAPEAPVIPRKTCTSRLPGSALALGGLEEVGQLLQVLFAEPREHRHHVVAELARVRDVALEVRRVLPLLGADVRQVWCARVGGSLAGIRVAAGASGLEEERQALLRRLGQVVVLHDGVERLLVG